MPSTSSRREPRDWEQANDLPRDWGNDAPDNVGKQSRRKNVAKMEKRAQEQAVDDDPDDWFVNSRRERNHGGPQSRSNAPSGPKRMSFGKSLQDAGRQFQPPPSSKPSLLERLEDNAHRGHSHDQSSRSSRSKHDRDYRSHNHSRRDDKYGQDRDRYHRREEPGPRYKGGYRR